MLTGFVQMMTRPLSPGLPAPAYKTISELFELVVLPDLIRRGRALSTIADYRRHVRRWRAWCCKYWMGNPVLAPLRQAAGSAGEWEPRVDQFSIALLESYRDHRVGLGDSPRAANKATGAVQAILAAAHRRGEAPAALRVDPLPEQRAAAKVYFTYDQVDRLFRACEAATWPRYRSDGSPLPWSPRRYWRAAIVLYWSYGFRTEELIAYRRCEALRWAQIHATAESPAIDGRAENAHGWLHYTPAKQARAKPAPLVLPLSAEAAAAIKSIEPPGGRIAERPLFPFPLSPDCFYATWRAIVDAAGIAPKVDLATGEAENFKIKHFRKTCETWLATEYGEEVARSIVGHAARDVAGAHYINRERQQIEAINGIGKPASFTRLFQTETQLELF